MSDVNPLIEDHIEIAASPERVWSIVSDPRVMGGLSPQVVRTVIRGEDPIGLGTRTVNLNRRGFLIWPTRGKVIRFEPHREYAYRIKDNKAIWAFLLEPTATGTRLTHRREASEGLSDVSMRLQDKVLGGTAPFEQELLDGIGTTLRRVKVLAEQK